MSSSSNSSNDKFFLETDDVLGFAYAEYISKIRGLALSKPSEYFELRATVMKTVKRDAVKNLYKSIFNVLSKGTDVEDRHIGRLGQDLIPAYPKNKINDYSIEVAAYLGDSLNKVIDII